MTDSRGQADPIWPLFAVAIAVIGSAVISKYAFGLPFLTGAAEISVGALLILVTTIFTVWAVQLAHGWWRKRGETA